MPDETENEQQNTGSETPGSQVENLLNQEIKAEKEKKTKKPKPTLEGINAPASTPVSTSETITVKPTLTMQEKRLISETDNIDLSGDEPEEVEEKPEKPSFEPKLIPKSVVERVNNQQKSSSGKLIGIVILLLLGFAAYQFYQVWGLNSQPTTIQQPKDVKPADSNASTTIVEMPKDGNTATSTKPSDPTPQPTPPPIAPEKTLKIKSTPTGWLNFRTGPGLNYGIISKVHPGETYPYSETKNGWYKITLPDGKTGWVTGEYITVQ